MLKNKGFYFVSILLFALALVFATYRVCFLVISETAQGTVTHFEENLPDPDDESQTITYYPHYSFQTESGQTVKKRATLASYPINFQVGDAIEIRYMGFHPEWAIIDGTSYKWGVSILFTTMGLGFLLFYILSNTPLFARFIK